MTAASQPPIASYAVGVGIASNDLLNPVISTRIPNTNDSEYPVGKRWIVSTSNVEYSLTSKSSSSGVVLATWTLLGNAGGALDTLSDQSATPITPVAGNIQIDGTPDQITTTAGVGTLTIAFENDVIFPNNLEVTGDLTVDNNTLLSGTLDVVGLSTLAEVTAVGTASINGSGAAATTIGSAAAGAITVSTGAQLNIASAQNAASAIVINSSAGGIDITAAGAATEDIDITNTAGSVNIIGGEAAVANAVRIQASAADGGIDMDSGTGGIAIDSTAAISIDSATASNFTVTGAGADLTLSSVGGSILVESTENAANAIRLHANGGTSETIQIHSDQGTGASSVNILSDVGGITLTATALASADAINLEAGAGGIDADAALQINVTSSQDAADAIRILASAGGIDIDAVGAAGQDIVITNTGGSVSVIATESASDAIVINASGAAGGVQLQAGTGGVNCTTDFNLTSVATKITMNGGAVTDFIGTGTLTNGTSGAIANTNIAAGDRIFLSRTAVNASTALGMLTYSISAGASFTVTAVETATPGDVEVNDQSSFAYFIVRQT